MANQKMQRRSENRPPQRQAAQQIRTVTPPVDVYDSDDHLLLVADMPGVAPQDVEIEVDHRTLLVQGHRGTGEQALRFRRQFHLPDPIDSDRITADCANGILTLTLPYRDQVKPRRIEVKG